MLERQDGYPPIGQAGPERPILKVIMVHGVGTHVPGYSARLSANLAQSLGLTVVAPEAKSFPIESPAFPGETLGTLTVTRHTNAARDREMLFFELTWSPISQPAKDAIAFDNTAVYARQRAAANNIFKQFVNDVAPDPLVYTGTGRERIQVTIGQALCWAISADWQRLPDEQRICTPDTPGFASRLDTDEFVFITHSLGSRITTDGLQRLTQVIEVEGRNRPEVGARVAVVPGARRQGVHARQPAAAAPERPGARERPGRRAGLLPCRTAPTSPAVCSRRPS